MNLMCVHFRLSKGCPWELKAFVCHLGPITTDTRKKRGLNLALIHQFQKGPLSTKIPCWHPCSSTASTGKLSRLSTLTATNNDDARRTPANGDNVAQNIVNTLLPLCCSGRLRKQEVGWPWAANHSVNLMICGKGRHSEKDHDVRPLTFCPLTPWQSHFPQPEPPQP